MTEPPRKNALTILLFVIIVIMGAEIVYLTLQNRKLRAAIEDPSNFYRTLQSDQRVPELQSPDISGNQVEIHYSDQSPYTLLIWFSPTCHVCEENLSFWTELLSAPPSGKLRTLVLCAGSEAEARAYVTQHSFPFPVVSVVDDRLVSAYNGYVLPQTALISPQGVIVESWPGALGTAQQDGIRDILKKIK
jgi:peroxiredoxin